LVANRGGGSLAPVNGGGGGGGAPNGGKGGGGGGGGPPPPGFIDNINSISDAISFGTFCFNSSNASSVHFNFVLRVCTLASSACFSDIAFSNFLASKLVSLSFKLEVSADELFRISIIYIFLNMIILK